MTALMRISMALLLSTLPVLTIAQAQDDLAEETLEIRRYTVEMIIFRYAQDVSTGSEIFDLEKRAEPDLTLDEEPVLIDGEALEEIEPVSRIYRDIEFTLLSRDELTMGEIMSRLQRLDVYKPLMHFGWTQATWPDESTLPIELSRLGRPPSELSGTLRLYLSRFLHLVVDLELDAPDESRSSAAPSSYGDYRSFDESSIDESRSRNGRYDFEPPPPVRYHINENRIFKSGDLRYFDHPKFGVLAKITRVDDEPEEALDPPDTELLGYPAQ
jgi:hypothetical protein